MGSCILKHDLRLWRPSRLKPLLRIPVLTFANFAAFAAPALIDHVSINAIRTVYAAGLGLVIPIALSASSEYSNESE